MSFPNNNYEAFQGQNPADQAGGMPSMPSNGAPPQQQHELNQAMESAPSGFPGPNMGAPGAAQSQPGGDQKTTLW